MKERRATPRDIYSNDRSQRDYVAMRRGARRHFPLGGILVALSIFGMCACVVCCIVFGLETAMRIMLAETLVLFGLIWTLSREN